MRLIRGHVGAAFRLTVAGVAAGHASGLIALGLNLDADESSAAAVLQHPRSGLPTAGSSLTTAVTGITVHQVHVPRNGGS